LPSSALSKACHYALTLWKKLTRFLEYPELELSTNLAENFMRPVAPGRKNWIHIGSPQAGPKGCGDSLGRGKLREVETSGARPSRCGSPRVWLFPDPVPPRYHSRCGCLRICWRRSSASHSVTTRANECSFQMNGN
jgi:hypothetical protein